MNAPCKDQPNRQSDSTPPDRTETHGGWCTWLLWSLAGVVIYVLSIGPVAGLDDRFNLAGNHPGIGRTLGAIYSPLRLVAKQFPATEHLYMSYLHLWVKEEEIH
jgi:hypothetical protein